MAPPYTTTVQTDVEVAQKTVRLGRRKRFLSRLSRFASTPQLRRSKRAQSTDKLLGRTSASCISLSSSRRSPTVNTADGEVVQTSIDPRPPAAIISPSLATMATKESKKPVINPFTLIPDEVKLCIFGYLNHKQRIAASGVCREWYRLCFDGQNWQTLDMREHYMEMPGEQLMRIISETGPFIKDLNLRGCIQLESELSNAADALYRCTNLRKLSLQGCHFLESRTIQRILKANPNLEHISLVGLMTRVTSSTCNTILNFNRNLRSLDVSSCRTITARSIKRIVANCPELICLAASGIRGFNDVSVANEIHRRNKLESLDLQGCNDFKDNSLKALMIGRDTVVDYFGEFNVEPRRLKVLNLSGCETLSDDSIQMMAGRVPDLEELFLSRNIRISDHSLNQILPTVPNLVTLELEELEGLTENFCTALASSPCAGNLRRLNLSSCINIPAESLSNLVPYLPSLTMLEVDGTNAGDSVIEQCLNVVRKRLNHSPSSNLHLRCFDCTGIHWQTINAAMIENHHIRQANTINPILTMHVGYEWQGTVTEYQTRLERGHYAAAWALQERWAQKMNAEDRRIRSQQMRRSRGAARSIGCSIM